MIRVVVCEAKRDCDPEDEPRWIGIVVVTRVEGSRIWFKLPPMRELRGDHKGRFPGHYWHFRLRPETMIELSKCDEDHTQTQGEGCKIDMNNKLTSEGGSKMSVVFQYHSTKPSDFSDIGGGAKVGCQEVDYTGNLEHMAAEGAIRLDLDPGRYLAVQAATKGDNCGHGIVIGWSWIIEVSTPVAKQAKVVKHEATR